MTLSEELTWRGFVNQTTLSDIKVLDKSAIKFYLGVDPTSDSMQVGNLATLLMVKHFKNHGHQPFLLVGGATGMIGDPAGKTEERQLLSLDQIAHNKAEIAKQFRRIINDTGVEIVDNYEWFKSINYLEFLRDVGKHFSMTPLLQRDYIAKRIGPNGSGMSYAEFSYTLIQGYDFWHLYKDKGVTLQVCGSDQWGNSISGVELVKKVEGAQVHIWSAPLVINKATGIKFGKSEDGAVWLDPTKTSIYKFYQFWLNVDDHGVSDYLKIFTELDQPTIAQIMTEFEHNPAGRTAQKRLAYEVTTLVHGHDQADKQVRIAEAIGSQDITTLQEIELATLREEIPSVQVAVPADMVTTLTATGIVASNSEARQMLANGAIYLNGHPTDKSHLGADDFTNGRLLIRRGKVLRNSALVEST